MDDALARLPCGWVAFDDDGTVLAVNDTLLGMLGYGREEVEGRHIETLLPLAGRVFYSTHVFPLLKMHGKVEEIYMLLQGRERRVLPVLAYGTRRERNECIFLPVTRRERYQDELAQARERLIGILGHDLRVPLTSIVLGAELLLRHETFTAEGQQAAVAILASARRAARMTMDLLDFTRARFAGGIPILRQEIDLRRVAEKVIAELRTIDPAAPVELQFDGDCRGSWDADRAAQVVSNLTGNAIRHRRGAGPVRVLLRGEEDAVILEVRNPIERPPEVPLEHLFSPFRQGSDSSGLGLGLFIVREIMKAHGGSVAATAEPDQFVIRAAWPRNG